MSLPTSKDAGNGNPRKKGDSLQIHQTVDCDQAVHGYDIRILPGTLYFDRVSVDDIFDHTERSYTIGDRLSKAAAIKIAFAAGYRAGLAAPRPRRKAK